MEFYITPDKRFDCEKALTRMFKHFEVKPNIDYSSVQKVTKFTIEQFKGGSPGENGCYTKKSILDAIKVTIEDIQKGEWILVANVNYKDGIIELVNSKLFKQIPEGYGLKYTKCDYCGSTHRNRNLSHILYNTNTNTWMQVGSSCVNKMINGGKYLCNLMLKLTEVFIFNLGGCDEEMWFGGGWMPKDNYWKAAVDIDAAIQLAKNYREDVNPVWEKTEYDGHGERCKEGTTFKIKEYVQEHINDVKIDEDYFKKVATYVSTLQGGEDYDGQPNMNQKMINAFNDGILAVSEMFLAFFAQKGYEDSLTKDAFAQEVEAHGIIKGEKYMFSGKLLSVEKLEPDYEYYNPYDWMNRTTYLFTLRDDATGILFEKEVANKSVMDAFKTGDDTYKFKGTVKYIAYKKQKVGFGGRLSKVK